MSCKECRMAKKLRIGNGGHSFHCMVTGISLPVPPWRCKICVTDEDIAEALNDVRVRKVYEQLSDPDNEEFRDENKILQQEVALLKAKLKKKSKFVGIEAALERDIASRRMM